ncbi:MAG: PHP domain-containing protein, partial [Clostridiales bacterium]|nr:PHP domain-containing protein [Clostridiales bacterium]
MGKFVHLHLHTEYSLLDGCVRLTTGAKHDVHPLADALKARGMDAVAITDHGNMYGVYSFVESLKGTGIKPIIGEEFYTCDNMYEKNKDDKRHHLILLAKNDVVYRNLIKLSTLAFIDGFDVKPRIDLDLLEKHSEGLICLSACIVGAIPRLLLEGKYDDAKAYAIRLRDMFAPGDFYIELQDHGIEEELRV